MKITILIQSVRYGGAERQAFETALELQTSGVDVEVIGLSEPNIWSRSSGAFGLEYPTIQSSTLAPRRFYFLLRAASLARRLFQLFFLLRQTPSVLDTAIAERSNQQLSITVMLVELILGSRNFGALSAEAVAQIFLKSPRVIVEARFLRAYFSKSRPDVILSFLTGPSFVATLVGQMMGVPAILSERNDLAAPWSSPDVDLLRKILYPAANLITANAEFATRDLEKKFGKNDVRWFPNHSPYRTREAVADLASRRNVCVICRLAPQKRVGPVIEAMASDSLKSSNPDLLVFGSGVERDALQKLAKRFRIERRVHFFGYRKRDDIARLLDGVGFIIVNSSFEGSSNSLHEAVQLGLVPMVASTVREIDDIVSPELRRRIITDGSSESIVQSLEKLLASDEYRRETLELVQRDFSQYWKRAMRQRREILGLIRRDS